MTLSELITEIWQTRNRQLAWGAIPDGHVIGQADSSPFKVDDDYVIVRLSSMFLKSSRTLWLKLSPLAYASVISQGLRAKRTDSAVVGPAQFGDLAQAPADRSIILNQLLSGPFVWRRGDLAIDAGLFAVPRSDAAAALMTAVSQLAGLGMPGLRQAEQIGSIVKSGVEGIIGLNGTKPVLAIRDVLKDGMRPGVRAALAAPAENVDFSQLWVRDGVLLEGSSAADLSPVKGFDYLLVGIEKGGPREDWRGMAALESHEAKFREILLSGDDSGPIKDALNKAFRAFDSDLSNEEGLSEPDKSRIRGQLITELQKRLAALAGPLADPPVLETRSVGGIERSVDLSDFSFLDVGEGRQGGEVELRAQGEVPFREWSQNRLQDRHEGVNG